MKNTLYICFEQDNIHGDKFYIDSSYRLVQEVLFEEYKDLSQSPGIKFDEIPWIEAEKAYLPTSNEPTAPRLYLRKLDIDSDGTFSKDKLYLIMTLDADGTLLTMFAYKNEEDAKECFCRKVKEAGILVGNKRVMKMTSEQIVDEYNKDRMFFVYYCNQRNCILVDSFVYDFKETEETSADQKMALKIPFYEKSWNGIFIEKLTYALLHN